jgi:hypothetical protein
MVYFYSKSFKNTQEITMRKIYQIFIFISLCSISFLLNPSIYAAEGLKIGDAEVIPWGEIKLQYDDNVFLDSNNEKDDFIVTLTPGVSLEWPFSDNLLKLDYHVDFVEFMDYSSQNAKNHYLSGEAEVNWRDISFSIYDEFEHVFERPSTEDTSRVKRDDNRAGIKARIERERLGIQLGYEHFIRNYKSDPTYEAYDRGENLYSLMLTHQTFPKTDLLFEYDFAQIRYDESTHSDSDYHQFLVGAVGDLTPKTTATIKTGYQTRDYKRESDSDFDNGVLYADITHKFSPKDVLKTSLLLSAEESTYGSNNYYKVENISATFDHLFNSRLLGFVAGAYQINSYPIETTEGAETKKRKDKYSSIGAGFKYYMRKWLTLTLRADHIFRNSNFDVFEYDQNLITLTARAEF